MRLGYASGCLVSVLLALVAPATARADEPPPSAAPPSGMPPTAMPLRCPAPEGASPALAEIDGEARLAFLTRTLQDQSDKSIRWTVWWGVAGAVLLAGNATEAGIVTDKDDRTDAIVGAATSILIPVLLAVKPLAVVGDNDALRASLARRTPGDTCALVAKAETVLAHAAAEQALNTAWIVHALNIVINGGIGLTLAVGYGHWKGGAVNGLGGIAIGETQILTHPRGAMEGLAAYRRGDVGAPKPAPVQVNVVPAAAGIGLGLGLRF